MKILEEKERGKETKEIFLMVRTENFSKVMKD